MNWLSNIKTIIVLLIIGLFAACSATDGCRQNLASSMHVSLYRMVYDSVAEQFVAHDYRMPVYVVGVGRDSLLYDSAVVAELNLPLQMFDTVSSFMLATFSITANDTVLVADTIDIHHVNEQSLVSLECGCTVNNTITAVATTVNSIDSITLVSPYVSYQNIGNNIRIYMRER